MYAEDTAIYFNLEDFDPSCIEAEITNDLDKVNFRLRFNKLSLIKYTENKVNGSPSKANKC